MTHSVRLTGFLDFDYQPYIHAYLVCPTLGERPYSLLFLIDTGCTNTTLLDADVERLNIDVSMLKKCEHTIVGIGGAVPTYELHDVSLIFDRGQRRFHTEHLDKIEVMLHDTEEDIVRLPFSLLGADVLSRFHFDYDDDLIFLEK